MTLIKLAVCGAAGVVMLVSALLSADRTTGLTSHTITAPIAACMGAMAVLLPWIEPRPYLDWPAVGGLVLLAVLAVLDCRGRA